MRIYGKIQRKERKEKCYFYFEPGLLTGPIVYLPLNALLLGYTTMLAFYMGAGDSNSNSYAFDRSMTK